MSCNNLVQSVDRAISILELLGENVDGLSLGVIANSLSLNKTTAHRIIQTLRCKGFITQEDDGKYLLDFKILYLSNCITKNFNIFTVSKPLLEDFASKVDATIHISKLDDTKNNIVYLSKIEPKRSNKTFIMSSRVGKTAPCYCTASGKLLLSPYTNEEIEKYMKDVKFKKYTENTLKNMPELLKEIEDIRTLGYAIDRNEYDSGILCISMPIYDKRNKMKFAISLTELIIYSDLDKLIALKDDLLQITNKISSLLKFT